MFRNRVRPPTPPLDDATAELLLGGAPIADLPDAFQPLGELLAAASGRPSRAELEGSAAAAAAFVAAHDAARPKRRTRSMAASVFAALALAATTGTAVAATQGALPEPVQQVAHEALGVVGITVPGITSDDRAGERGGGSADTPTVSTVGTDDPATNQPTLGGATTATDGSSKTVTPSGDTTATDGTPQDGNQGNPDPGNGNGNGGEGNGGEGNPDQGNPMPGTPPAAEPGNILPPQSNGNGNGPPQLPPGQEKEAAVGGSDGAGVSR